MNYEVKLSVREILKNPHFRNARVVAGEAGLGRLVRWVHVLEVTSISNLLDGNELILSTGIGWSGNQDAVVSLVQQSIDSHAAGLCIELGKYISAIPQEAIELANSHEFPLITFIEEVRFIDITQEIHSLLIKKHYQVLTDLEDYSNRLNQVLLSSNPQQKILQLLHEHLGMPVLYITNQGDAQIISKKPVDQPETIFEQLKNNQIPIHMNVAHSSVHALNQTFADLFIISEAGDITEFESLILDRSAIALAQSLLRELYIEEQRIAKEVEWVSSWLEGGQSHEQINKYLFELEPKLKPNIGAVLLCKADNLNKVISEFTYLKVYFRSIFEQRGILLLSHVQKNQLAFVLLNTGKTQDFKRRVQEGIDCLKESEFIKKQSLTQLQFGVGKTIHTLTHVPLSYQSAIETLNIREQMPQVVSSYFYEDLYIFRLVLAAKEQGVLQDFISDYIGPVLDHDQQNNGEVLKTLKVYLQCKGSKKETSEQLHIVRQTLYHRLTKLYELIGNDFMDPYKRQAIEVAISAYEYVTASQTPVEHAPVIISS